MEKDTIIPVCYKFSVHFLTTFIQTETQRSPIKLVGINLHINKRNDFIFITLSCSINYIVTGTTHKC